MNTSDSPKWRGLIIVVLLSSTAHTGVIAFSMYRYLITNFSNLAFVPSSEWNLVAHFAIFTFISLIVQLYYAAKIATLFSSKWKRALVGSIVVLALAQTGFGIAACVSTWRLPVADNILTLTLRSQLGWQMLAALAASVFCDLLISGAMFKDARTPRYTVRVENPLQLFSRLVIETNLLTTSTAIVNMIFFFIFHSNGISIAFSVVTPKLYLLSMLFSMNHYEGKSLDGISSRSVKHQSTLSDFFKGTPFRGRGVSSSAISKPIPQVRFDESPVAIGSPTWRRSPVTSPEKVDQKDSMSISDYGGYGGFSSSIYLGSPKAESFNRQPSPTPVHNLFVSHANAERLPSGHNEPGKRYGYL